MLTPLLLKLFRLRKTGTDQIMPKALKKEREDEGLIHL